MTNIIPSWFLTSINALQVLVVDKPLHRPMTADPSMDLISRFDYLLWTAAMAQRVRTFAPKRKVGCSNPSRDRPKS